MKKLLLLSVLSLGLFSCTPDDIRTEPTNQNPIDTQAQNTVVLKEFLVEAFEFLQSDGSIKYQYMFQANFKSTYSIDKKGSVKIYFTENGISKTKLVENYFKFDYYIGTTLINGNPLKANSITNFRNNNWYSSKQNITIQNVEFIPN
jgi:hypothetical protein